VLETSARLLRLLSLLQALPDWTGPALAERLEVSTRTVRRDVERLRALGYPVVGGRGHDRGYRLGAGAELPPLLLDDDEAVAAAVGLRTAAGGTVTGIEEASLRALNKLEQVLPSRLRHKVRALGRATAPALDQGPRVDADLLVALAAASRDRETVRFDYRTHDGTVRRRTVEPHALVPLARRWYLLGWDTDRQDWRTMRLDRVESVPIASARFTPRPPPDGDAAAFVARGVTTSTYRYRARITIHAPIEAVAASMSPGSGTLEAIDDEHCLMRSGAESLDVLAVYVALTGFDFEIHDPPELIDHVRAIADRLARAADLANQ
jgi:predicted DNA-binding transcriptional regulator YafY